MEGVVINQPILILIDPGSNFSYILLKVAKKCPLKKKTHEKSWLLKLAMGSK